MKLLNKTYPLKYNGKGSEYFGIIIINWLLTIVTLGIYYPWAKAKQLKYLYSSTNFNDDAFTFHGTGNEMFKGFIKALLIFAVIYGVFFFLTINEYPVAGILFLYAAIIALLPIAIHGSYRYRMSRTTWRGVRFGYRGDRKEFIGNFFKWVFFTIITFGFYGAWLTINLRKYVIEHIRMGNLKFRYIGNGTDFFILNLIGYLLTILTLGIYSFWWQRDLFAYFVDNIRIDGEEHVGATLKSNATAGDFFNLLVGNILILIFTLGIGYAWVVNRNMVFGAKHIIIEGNINFDRVQQTEDDYRDATGEDVGDILDIDLI
tara:strand:- start:969 stop:1919 length:951 start_codon:yes stop_codon:yes gene_type:complete